MPFMISSNIRRKSCRGGLTVCAVDKERVGDGSHSCTFVTDVLDACDESRSALRFIWSWREFVGAAEVEVLAELRYVHHTICYMYNSNYD